MSGQREHYRIQYTDRERLWLTVGESTLAIHDLSEGGVCVDKTPAFKEGLPPQEVAVVFRDSSRFLTTAVFVRNDDSRTVIRFLKLLPLALILAEQRRLRLPFRYVD